MKASELRDKSTDELDALAKENLNKLFKLRMQKSSDQLNTNHLFKKLKREVARIYTIKNEKAAL